MGWTRRGFRVALLLLAGVSLLAGCQNAGDGRGSEPAILRGLEPATGSSATVRASNYGNDPVKIELIPLDSTATVKTRHLLIATVSDQSGPKTGQLVQWSVEGAGQIVDIDDAPLLGRGEITTPQTAYSHTCRSEHQFKSRGGNGYEVTIHPGQTWCVITSDQEGDSHILVRTASSPSEATALATKHWLAAQWTLPASTIQRPGTRPSLTTSFAQPTDRARMDQYRVRYTLLDGPAAVLLSNAGSTTIEAFDEHGNATATLVPSQPLRGLNRINVEVLRAPTSPGAAPVVVTHGIVQCEWQNETVALALAGPPQAIVGQDAAYTITVSNPGRMPARFATVKGTLPEGVTYVSADPPPANGTGKDLVWTLKDVQAGQNQSIRLVLRPTTEGTLTTGMALTTDEGSKDQKSIGTQVTAARLKVAVHAPTSGAVGVGVPYEITVTNSGTAPATNVQLVDKFDKNLHHVTGGQSVQLMVGTLAPGQSRTERLVLTPMAAGKVVNQVIATADGNQGDSAEQLVAVQEARLTMKISGPEWSFADRPAKWTLQVSNSGPTAITDVELRDQLPPELLFQSATLGGQLVGGQVVWKLGTLQPNEQKAVELQALCLRAAARAVQQVVAGVGPELQVRDEAAVEIRGIPAYRLEVIDSVDPVPVNGVTTYRIDVLNQGTLEGNQVQIVATVPKEMQVLRATGPSAWRQEGDRIVFQPADGLQPRQMFTYTIDVRAVQAAGVVLRVELKSATLTRAIVVEEPTRIFAPPGAALPSAPPTQSPEPPR